MRRRAILLLGLGIGTLMLSACGEEIFEPVPIDEIEFAPSLGVDLEQMTRLDSGVYIENLVEGTGDMAAPGDSITVDYAGYTVDGTRFDHGEDVSFPIGVGLLIKGWDLGIPGMRVGGKRKLVIPWNLAYGATGQGPIPPYATLVFDVELTGVTPAESD